MAIDNTLYAYIIGKLYERLTDTTHKPYISIFNSRQHIKDLTNLSVSKDTYNVKVHAEDDSSDSYSFDSLVLMAYDENGNLLPVADWSGNTTNKDSSSKLVIDWTIVGGA